MLNAALLVISFFVSSHAHAAAKLEKQIVEVAVTEKGFEPAMIPLVAGRPVQLKVTRKTDETCATEIQFPAKKIKKTLPLNKTVVIELGPLQKGELKFGCGMNMMESGKIVVQ